MQGRFHLCNGVALNSCAGLLPQTLLKSLAVWLLFMRARCASIAHDHPLEIVVRSDQFMKTFIRVVELWVPDRTRTRLEYGGGLCSNEYSEFRALSEDTLFAYNEGLPGKAWASGHPIILTEFSGSYFKRKDEAKEAGLTCGVALPVFAGEFLMAVMVLFCGDDEKHVGAIELWHNDPEVSHEMGLVDGYYGTADMFEFNSRHTKFPRGFGLPGRTWKANMPLIIKDVYNSKQFLRWEEASEIGINCGVGIPYRTSVDQTWVMTFLSAQATPIAERFEIWIPNASRDAWCSNQAIAASKLISTRSTVQKRSAEARGQSAAPGQPACRQFAKI